MRERRQAHRRHQRRAFIIQAQLVDTAFITIEQLLQRTHRSLGKFNRRMVVQIGQIDKNHRDPAQIGEPGRLAGHQPVHNGTRQVGTQCRLDSRVQRGALAGLRRQRRMDLDQANTGAVPVDEAATFAATAPGNETPGRLGHHHIAGPGQLLGQRQFDQRLTGDQEFPAPVGAANMHKRQGTTGHHNAQVERAIRDQAVKIADPLLDAQRTLGRPQDRTGHAFALRRPDRQQGIAGKLDHIAAMHLDDIQQLAEGNIEDAREFFDTGRATERELFGQRCETGDIGKEHAGIQRGTRRQARQSRAGRIMPHHLVRQITGNNV